MRFQWCLNMSPAIKSSNTDQFGSPDWIIVFFPLYFTLLGDILCRRQMRKEFADNRSVCMPNGSDWGYIRHFIRQNGPRFWKLWEFDKKES